MHAAGDIAGMETEHQLGLLPHQIQGSLPKCVLSTVIGNSSSKCTACSNVVSKLQDTWRHIIRFIILMFQILAHLALHCKSSVYSDVFCLLNISGTI